MNNTTHTPGPWKLSLGFEYVIDGGNGQNVLLIGNDRRAIPSTDDARLILAAPDLLAELIRITDAYAKAMKNAGVTHYPEALVEVRQARAAIAKATGEAK